MTTASDYFLLCHGIHFSQEEDEVTLNVQKAEQKILPYFALLLMISRKDFDNFLSLSSLQPLCEALSVDVPKELSGLHALQYAIIKVLEKDYCERNSAVLVESFTHLMQEGVLAKEHYKKLLSLFRYQKKSSDTATLLKHRETFSFKEEKEEITQYMDLLSTLGVKREKLDAIQDFLASQSFSVGITGVMNAGKSTMVNALLGKEILGTAVVPETANLTVLKYSKNSAAKVHYWDQHEWQAITQAAQSIEAMQRYVEETEKAFKSDLSAYIKAESRVDEIEVKELPAYTSAADSGKRCNLVKYVELYSDLPFLQDAVEIVDTPGLDDPVIQREEITKAYISRSDMLLHLMNVSQSATQKDVEFIIDALLYQNVSKLLIVITRSDTVSKKELDEVIAYTRHSIHKELKVQNKESKLDYILETLDFIGISGKMALTCRMDSQKAEEKGYTLEKSGLPVLENYLQTNLFGSKASKSRVRIEAAKRQLLACVEEEKRDLSYALELSSQSKEELEASLSAFQKEKARAVKNITMFKEDIRYEKHTLEELVKSLEHFLDSEFFALKTILRERVVSDVRYAYQTTKTIPQSSRTKVIVNTALKDGMIDIIRAYRYKIQQKFEALDEVYAAKYQRYHLHETEVFDAALFFEDAFMQGFLTHNNTLLLQQIIEAVKSSKAKALAVLDAQIKHSVDEAFKPVERETAKKLHALSYLFIAKFTERLGQPLVETEKQYEAQEQTLHEQLEHVLKQEGQDTGSSIQMHEKIKKLSQVEALIKGVPDVQN